jgi:hypothetical protein
MKSDKVKVNHRQLITTSATSSMVCLADVVRDKRRRRKEVGGRVMASKRSKRANVDKQARSVDERSKRTALQDSSGDSGGCTQLSV